MIAAKRGANNWKRELDENTAQQKAKNQRDDEIGHVGHGFIPKARLSIGCARSQARRREPNVDN